MAYKNQNYMTNAALKEQADKAQKGYQEETFKPTTYYFKSYNDDIGTTLWGTGTVETTGVETDGYTEVEIKTNDTEASFIGQKVYVTSDAKTDASTLYPLYSDAGTTALGIYVKISTSEITDSTVEFTPITYHFKSYDDTQGTTLWGTGTVETTGVETNGYTEVEVKTNDTDASFIGQKVFVISNAKTDASELYPLYSDAGTTALGIYVKISTSEITEDNSQEVA